MRLPQIVVASLFLAACCAASDTLIALGGQWRFLASGEAAPAGWTQPGFDDRSWAIGAAKLGTGQQDHATFFPPPTVTPRVTVYFRRTFTLTAPANSYSGLFARMVCDAGAVLYLNGVEVGRINMPAGEITPQTYASREPYNGEEGALQPLHIGAVSLADGVNTLAVELHMSSSFDFDLDFDLQLIGSQNAAPVFLVRGPYLQNGAPDAVTVRWRTESPTPSIVRAGLSMLDLDRVASELTPKTEHEVRLTGLQPDTLYYYAIDDGVDFVEGPSGQHHFRTPPSPGTVKPVRIWVLGDSGTGRSGLGSAEAVRDAYLNSPLYQPPDVWLMLGDNAYGAGSDSEYQDAVFDTYPETLRSTILWPALGNHETYTPGTPYFSIFTLPTLGEGGGVASGTEHYFSFDHGNIHFVCLDSQSSLRTTPSPMLAWLEADLASTTQRWIIAYWHHPPYTKGTHDSDWETEHIEMRENAVPILEQHGVDLVLGGHSHVYERSHLIDGHYGYSWDWDDHSLVDAGSGRADEPDGAYGKDPSPHRGAVYCVAGCSGGHGFGSLDHPAMFLSLSELGSLILDVNGDRLDAMFLSHQGVVRDYFTISKAPLVTIAAPAPQLTEQGGAPGRVRLSRDREMARPISVQLALGGSATPGSDYTPPLLPAVIPAGAHTLELDFAALSDTLAEGAEAIAVTLLADDTSYRAPKLANSVTLSIADRPIDAWRFLNFGANANNSLIAGDAADPDGDGQDNIAEYLAGTGPLSGASWFRANVARNAAGRIVVRVLARKGRSYVVWFRSSLTSGAWQSLATIAAPALDQIVEVPDLGADSTPQRFYRITTGGPE
jgi:hypothetical protein